MFRIALPIMLCLLLLAPASAAAQDTAAAPELPEELAALTGAGHSLPRYHEARYHPLGRNPVVDAALADPCYLPAYGLAVERQLPAAHRAEGLPGLVLEGVKLTGWPLPAADAAALSAGLKLAPPEVPEELAGAIGKRRAATVMLAVALVNTAQQIAADVLAPLTPEEREWLLAHPEAYFFGTDGGDEYDFFTTDSSLHLRIFELAARCDLPRLAEAEVILALAAEQLAGLDSAGVELEAPYTAELDGISIAIGGTGPDRYEDDFALVVDFGGDDVYLNNAGGTAGVLPAALLVDLSGNDRYDGGTGSQGAGLLGCGLLMDVSGNDLYTGGSFAQAAAYFGHGVLADREGADEYRGNFCVQGAALFGQALLYDGYGDDHYEATGMAQSAASTLGGACLYDAHGDDRYRVGGPFGHFWVRRMGGGQGFASGTRYYPWPGQPSFYGGVALLADSSGADDYYCNVFGQGSAYFLSLGVLTDGGGNDRYAGVDSQGQGLHLAAGLLLELAGDDYYSGNWGSQGTSGDRSAGILIDTAGNDTYTATNHNLGTARKPLSIGFFADLSGNDYYEFTGESCARVQRPSTPDAWPYALFLDLGGSDRYPAGGELLRGDGMAWGLGAYGRGRDMELALDDPAQFFRQLPAAPRTEIPLDINAGWEQNVTARPLSGVLSLDITATVDAVLDGGYDARRHGYERLDLARFLASKAREQAAAGTAAEQEPAAGAEPQEDGSAAEAEAAAVEPETWALDLYGGTADIPEYDWAPLAELLANPGLAPTDRLAYAALWQIVAPYSGPHLDSLRTLRAGLDTGLGSPADPYARQLLIRMLAPTAGELFVDDFARLATEDPDPGCRKAAAYALAQAGTAASLKALLPCTSDPAPVVRYYALAGLRDSTVPGALDYVLPSLEASDLYVRRAAAVTAISLGFEPAIGVLLDSCRTATLDTGENYGHNLFATLAEYVGEELYVEYGTDLEQWLAWWEREGASLRLPEPGATSVPPAAEKD